MKIDSIYNDDLYGELYEVYDVLHGYQRYLEMIKSLIDDEWYIETESDICSLSNDTRKNIKNFLANDFYSQANSHIDELINKSKTLIKDLEAEKDRLQSLK
ncbi:MAG: hypothetical protein LUD48_03200 [Prevotella sp.]|nr:hypothetical protein [Prevotella sp.]